MPLNKKFLILTLAFTLILRSDLSAAEIEFTEIQSENDWNEALGKAMAENKLVFVDVYTDWCGYCKMMDREVYSDHEVAGYFNEHFINVKLDAETDFGGRLAEEHEVVGFPTMFFINVEGKVLENLEGYLDEDQLLATGRVAQSMVEELPVLEASYAAGELEGEDLFRYVDLLAMQDLAKATTVFDAYYAALSEEDKGDPENLDLAAQMDLSMNSEAGQYILTHREAITGVEGEGFFSELVYSMLQYHTEKAIAEKDEQQLEAIAEKLLPLIMESGDEDADRLEIYQLYYAGIEDWDAYAALVRSDYESKHRDDPDFLLAEAYYAITEFGSEEIAGHALAWLNEYAEIEPSFDAAVLSLNACAILGRYAEARDYLRVAEKLASDDDERELLMSLSESLDADEADSRD